MTDHPPAPAYTGPDRRIGSRRAHEKRQRNRVWQEKVKFLNRTMLTCSFMFIAIVLVGVFLMAPEYARIKSVPAGANHLGRHARIAYGGTSFAARLNSFIEGVEQSSGPVTDTVGEIATSAAGLILNPGSGDFSQVLNNVSALRQQEGGNAAVSQSIDRLRGLLSSSDVNRPEDVDRVVNDARKKDAVLDSLMGSVKSEDVEAGAMLLVLNEFRSDVDNQRPYADDLVLLKKFAGDDPRMSRALMHLAPYAESGVMSRETLQAELKGLAGDIVTAQLQGKDVSVQDAARKRFERLSRASSVDQIKGETPDAVVARAQLMLDKGNIRGAMRELQKLDGASAEAAQPWMNNATNYVVADSSSEDLTQTMLQTISGAGSTSVQSLMATLKESLSGPSVPYLSPALINRNSNGGKDVLAPSTR